MEGFDPRFRDIPDYILGVTKAIWEDRGVSTLEDYYAKDIVVRSPASVVIGNDGIIAATLATLHEFPNRQLYGEDVIWCDAPGNAALSSHRLVCTATHTGEGAYGNATGREFRYRIIADCHCGANTIDDEWLVRDQGAIARQMGTTPEAYARKLIADEGGPESCVRPLSPATDVTGPYAGRGNDNAWGARYAEIVSAIMAGDLSVIPKAYDRAVHGAYAGGVDTLSWEGVDRFWLSLRSAFPSATFTIDHVIGRDDPAMPPRAALRWSLQGRHDGWGAFGRPTGAEVYVLGMCHADFGALGGEEPRIRREYALIDETAIWKQILLAIGDV